MDYTIGALKLMCSQLKETNKTPMDSTQSSAYSFAGIIFQRVWLQGVILSSYPDDDSRYLLDDGTAVIEVSMQLDAHKRRWDPGMYVMVVGSYSFREAEPMIMVHKIVDLSAYPDREAMWYLEVIEACKMLYFPLFVDSD